MFDYTIRTIIEYSIYFVPNFLLHLSAIIFALLKYSEHEEFAKKMITVSSSFLVVEVISFILQLATVYYLSNFYSYGTSFEIVRIVMYCLSCLRILIWILMLYWVWQSVIKSKKQPK